MSCLGPGLLFQQDSVGFGFGGGNIDLRIADDSAAETTWSLATLSGSDTVGTFDVYVGSTLYENVALGDTLGAGRFAAYGFTLVDGENNTKTLLFAQLSA